MKTEQLQYHLENHSTKLSSDHTPIIIEISHQSANIYPPRPLRTIDWEQFEADMKLTTLPSPNITNPKEIEKSIENLTRIISTTISNNTSTSSPTNHSKILPKRIQIAITQKRRLRAQWQRSRDPTIKTALNKQTSIVRELLSSYRDDEWSSFIFSTENHADGRSKLYKLNRSLLRKKLPHHPLENSHSQLVYENQSIAELFADCMEKQFSTTNLPHPNEHYVEETLQAYKNSLKQNQTIYFTPGEIQKTIRHLPTNKAPGNDSITNHALKRCSNKDTILHLCKLFNGCIRQEYFPSQSKTAKIIMLPKPGKNTKLPINYRPISLLNSLSKVYERLILNRLNIYVLPKIRPEQFGFRPQHSTTTQLINVIDNISNNINRRKITAAALLDIEKAFDKVWHDGLLVKLLEMEIPRQLINTISSFLKNRQFFISIDNTNSSTRLIRAGVPQGSCLSPHLFSVYINDMPLHPSSKMALFADDTLIYASSNTNNNAVNNLQKQIDLLQPWFDEWKVSINPSKTNTILFSHKQKQNSKKLIIQNTEIPWSNSIKYLGIHIDSKLNFSKHVKITINKTKYVRYQLFPILNHKSQLSTKTKLFLYKTYLLPVLTYASPAWISFISFTNLQKLETFQSATLRTISKLPWFVNNTAIRKQLNMPSISVYTSIITNSTKQRIQSSPFTHIQEIANRPSICKDFQKINRPINF